MSGSHKRKVRRTRTRDRRFARDQRDAMVKYNRLPFQGRAHRETHPRRVAAHVRLYGLEPPPTETCRVLELGCASGDNLIGMAAGMPDATFVGIDIAERQVELGRKTVAALDLRNVTLEHQGILEVSEALGTFDYIIAHGVYSWVPAPVRDKTLEILASNLSENGVAYICYNTYPGWHFRETVRNFVRDHVTPGLSEAAAAAEARSWIERFARGGVPDTLFAQALAREAELFHDLPDGYLYHEMLETDNFAIYFKAFVEQARKKGLAYVTDTEPFTVLLDNLDKDVADWVFEKADRREDVEQSLDYLYGRTIRHSLLVHRSAAIRSWPDAAAVEPLFVAGNPKPDPSPPPLDPNVPVRFSAGTGKALGVRSPISKVTMGAIAAAWPAALSFSELQARVSALLAPHSPGAPPEREVREVIARTLLAGHACGLLDLLDSKVPVAEAVGERPVASALSRFQVDAGRPFVTSVYHEEIALPGTARRLLRLLDGRHTVTGLLSSAERWASSGSDTVPRGRRPSSPGVRQQLHRSLEWLWHAGLLVPFPSREAPFSVDGPGADRDPVAAGLGETPVSSSRNRC